MGWTYESDDQFHDMTIRAEFEDGAVSGGGSTIRDGVDMVVLDDYETWRPAGEIVAWRIVCNCEKPIGTSIHSIRTQWVSSTRWVRVASRHLEDVAAGRIYAADEASPESRFHSPVDIDLREEVEEAAKAIWRREHLHGIDIADEIAAALAMQRAATTATDVAVERAQRAGWTWQQIGEAAGMTAAGANSRWRERIRDEILTRWSRTLDDMAATIGESTTLTGEQRAQLSIAFVLADYAAGTVDDPTTDDVLQVLRRLELGC